MDAIIKQAVREELRHHLNGRGRKLGVLGKLGNFGESVSEVFNSEFSILHYTQNENSEMKTSECCFKPFYQTPSFANSEFSILHYTQNGKLGDENLGVLFQAFLPNSEFFQFRVFHFALYPKRKTWK